MLDICVFSDPEALSLKAAEIFVTLSKDNITSKKKFVVAVSGGSTPIRLYDLLGSDQYRNQIDWKYVHFFWVDERFVPFSHKNSNCHLVHDHLLDKISIPRENIHSVKTDLPSPEVSAKDYEEEIKLFFCLSEGVLPQFDLILLGIGEDGHTASLFPDSEILQESKNLTASINDMKHLHYRITLTLPVINSSENVIFLVAGKKKAAVVKRVLQDKDASLPAGRVDPKKGSLIFLVDKSAGMYLDSRTKCV